MLTDPWAKWFQKNTARIAELEAKYPQLELRRRSLSLEKYGVVLMEYDSMDRSNTYNNEENMS